MFLYLLSRPILGPDQPQEACSQRLRCKPTSCQIQSHTASHSPPPSTLNISTPEAFERALLHQYLNTVLTTVISNFCFFGEVHISSHPKTRRDSSHMTRVGRVPTPVTRLGQVHLAQHTEHCLRNKHARRQAPATSLCCTKATCGGWTLGAIFAETVRHRGKTLSPEVHTEVG